MPTAIIEKFCQEELFNFHFYQWLAEKTPPNLTSIIKNFAQQEKNHYEFWKKLIPHFQARVQPWKLSLYKFLYYVLGITFILRAFEKREHETLRTYISFLPQLPPHLQAELQKLIEEEERHEESFTQSISEHEPRLRYVSFIVLGLADAIIEITGVHAGFLGISHQPLTAGLAGLIVGFAASISMSSAAYLQAKQNPQVKPLFSAVYTGISYFLAVILLALPYFLVSSMLIAFIGSIVVGISLIAAFVYYSAVVFERDFRSEFVESFVVLSATSILSYGFGELLHRIFPHVKNL